MSQLVDGRQVSLKEVAALATAARADLWQAAKAQGRAVIIYLHWSAGHYHQFYDDYHINIDADGSVRVTADDLATVKAHTWRRNSGAVGVALACAALATSADLGAEPPTDSQLECLARVTAVLASALAIPIDGDHVMTHAEAAELDGYGPSTTWERWDLWFLKNGDAPGSGGDSLRNRALYYQQAGADA